MIKILKIQYFSYVKFKYYDFTSMKLYSSRAFQGTKSTTWNIVIWEISTFSTTFFN